MHLNFFQDIARQTLDFVFGVGYEYKQWRVLQNSGSISLPTFCSRNMTQNCARPLFMFFVFCSGYRVFQTFKTYDVRHPLDLNVICTSDWNLKMSATYDITKLYFLLLDVFWNYGIHHSQIHMCFCMFALQLANRKRAWHKAFNPTFLHEICLTDWHFVHVGTPNSEDESLWRRIITFLFGIWAHKVFFTQTVWTWANQRKQENTDLKDDLFQCFTPQKSQIAIFVIRSRDDLIRRGWQKCDETPKIESCASWTIRKKGTVRDIVAVFKTRLVVLYKGLYYPVIQGLSRVLSFEQCSDD